MNKKVCFIVTIYVTQTWVQISDAGAYPGIEHLKRGRMNMDQNFGMGTTVQGYIKYFFQNKFL